MKQYHVEVYNINTLETVDEFTSSFEDYNQLKEFMDNMQLHEYNYDYYDLDWAYTERNKHKMMREIADKYDEYNTNTNTTPSHYKGNVQPIDLINAQNLNFNLGNVVKYVCRAGKKQGESNLKDLEKAKDYINYEIKRLNIKEN